eukprot:Pgem_evm2s2244
MKNKMKTPMILTNKIIKEENDTKQNMSMKTKIKDILQVEDVEKSKQSDFISVSVSPIFSHKRSKQSESPICTQQVKKKLDGLEHSALCKAILQAKEEKKKLESKVIDENKNDEENKNGKPSMIFPVVVNDDLEKAKSISIPVKTDDLNAK